LLAFSPPDLLVFSSGSISFVNFVFKVNVPFVCVGWFLKNLDFFCYFPLPLTTLITEVTPQCQYIGDPQVSQHVFAVQYFRQLCLYEVWQKSNATDFLLTTNFILFTNQGYPLQNSSFGQLRSYGGVVSIVRSSAGRLLLEYLSARWLRSSGCYPKYQNGALSSGF
jgi:hypothetical protein